jgi:hypothetical protein
MDALDAKPAFQTVPSGGTRSPATTKVSRGAIRAAVAGLLSKQPEPSPLSFPIEGASGWRDAELGESRLIRIPG